MPHANLCYEFGPYRFDSGMRILTQAGETISLTPKAADILMLLVQNAGQLVEKDELLKEVWPNTFVEEANLSQNIFRLRRALGDERAVPRYIETVPRRGYRFIAPVTKIGGDDASADGKANGAAIPEIPVIAVLPFSNTTGDPTLEYLAEGITDNIINNLSRLSTLRVMSRSAVFRYKSKVVDPQRAGKELGVTFVLVGRIDSPPTGLVIGIELMNVLTGWQCWGASYDPESQTLLEIQGSITRQILLGLKLTLTRDEEKGVTSRYTENAQAYQAYLKGRYHWSRYTRKGVEKAIQYFQHAIELDFNYALAYAGIVDCYLRLATNYLPPEEDLSGTLGKATYRPEVGCYDESDRRIRLRYQWDWKGAERELQRANDLKADYPSPYQWYVAYKTSRQLYLDSILKGQSNSHPSASEPGSPVVWQIPSVQLTRTEEIQILCAVARDQIAIGNFDAADLIMRRWCVLGKWPTLHNLNPYTAADLLFTLGIFFGCIAGSKKIIQGHKYGEAFLNGSVAIFEQLGLKSRSVEARVELARCYYRQGVFDIAREIISTAYSELPDGQFELKTLCLTVWGAIERDSGRLKDSLVKLREAASLEAEGRSVPGRCYHDLATTLKDLAISEQIPAYADEAEAHFLRALYECEAIGHHRFAAAVENNLGLLLLSFRSYKESEQHLLRSRSLFQCFADSVRRAQVNETLARLYIETKQYSLAQDAIQEAVETFELTDGEAFLAEALMTAGVVAARQRRYSDAKKCFEGAYKVAERCGHKEGAGHALLIMFEEIGDYLEPAEKTNIPEKLKRLFSASQQTALLVRVNNCILEISRK